MDSEQPEETEDTIVDQETVKDLLKDINNMQISEAGYQIPEAGYQMPELVNQTRVFTHFIRGESQPYSPIQWLEKISSWMFDDDRSEIVDGRKTFAFHAMFEVYVAAWFDCSPEFTGTVKRVGKPGDNGADILAIEQNPNEIAKPIIVQVKYGKSALKKMQSNIRDLVGSCVLHEVKRGYLATNRFGVQDSHKNLELFERKGYSITILGGEKFSRVPKGNAEEFARCFIKHMPETWKLQVRQ